MGGIHSKSFRRKHSRRKITLSTSSQQVEGSESKHNDYEDDKIQQGFNNRLASLYRVGSGDAAAAHIYSSNGDVNGDDTMEHSTRARSSTYSNVRDAVMHNLSQAERSKHDQSVPMGVIGLRNLGNTCFINSSLQCLSATIPLTDYFLGFDYRSEINRDNFLGTGGKLATSYAELMKKMWLGTKSTVEPIEFKEQLGIFAPQFSGYRQHDSQELLSFLLDGIHEDLNRVMSKPYIEDKDCDGTRDESDAIESWKNYLKRNKSLVVDLFQGQLRNTCRCLTCGHKNIRFEPFMYLSLPINSNCRSLEDCIDDYLQEETLEGAEQWYCGRCETLVDATKKIDLWILPPILIVHLKRFRYNDGGNVGSKNEAAIEYPIMQWDLKSRVKSKGSTYPMYDLYAVSNHMGSLGGGHYTALALNRFDDAWYEFNDSSYRCVEESIHMDHTKSAYVLFYNRSEGDTTMPLNERAPLIRRQSVSRPDLWPHTQVDDPRQVRGYRRPRASTIDLAEFKSPSSPRRRTSSHNFFGVGDKLRSPFKTERKKAAQEKEALKTPPASPSSKLKKSKHPSLRLDKGDQRPSSDTGLGEKKRSGRRKGSHKHHSGKSERPRSGRSAGSEGSHKHHSGKSERPRSGRSAGSEDSHKHHSGKSERSRSGRSSGSEDSCIGPGKDSSAGTTHPTKERSRRKKNSHKSSHSKRKKRNNDTTNIATKGEF
eukprot:scaffold2141_cov120-Cylindrotheca_fusiformis.AAC.25